MPQPARSGGATIFGPQTQEEAVLDDISRRLRGRTERLEAFAQAEVERTHDLERVILVSSSFFLFSCDFILVGARQRTHWV